VVALLGWFPGFVVNRLVSLLREQGYSLNDAFKISSQVAAGSQATIPFKTLNEADAFARAARALDVRLELRLPAAAS
jgi:hypothetical protein